MDSFLIKKMIIVEGGGFCLLPLHIMRRLYDGHVVAKNPATGSIDLLKRIQKSCLQTALARDPPCRRSAGSACCLLHHMHMFLCDVLSSQLQQNAYYLRCLVYIQTTYKPMTVLCI